MEIFKAGARPGATPNPDWFTGAVSQTPIIEAPAPARVRALIVRFEAGARTAWHAHPLGQTLHVLSGVGRVQKVGEPVREIAAGDTVWIAPDERHWHGAGPDGEMTHVAIQESLDGAHVVWAEKVTDAEYDGRG